MEFLGATLLGGEVVKTIRKGIADPTVFADNPPLLMWGCFCAITAVGVWLLLASRLEMPVSTTHSCVGGMIGMAVALRGWGAVTWYSRPQPPDKPLPGGFVGIVLSWFISPLLSAILASALFFCVRICLRSANPFERSTRLYPVLVNFCVTIITLFMLMKGIKSSETVDQMSTSVKVGLAFGIGASVALAAVPLYALCKRRILTGKFVAPKLAIEVAQAAQVATGPVAVAACPSSTNGPSSGAKRVAQALASSLNADVHAVVQSDAATMRVHLHAERFDAKSEAMFTYLQVFSAAFDAFSHGANDVANAVGPFATIYFLYHGANVDSEQTMGESKYWILGLGGLGIAAGLLFYGSQILRAIGVKLSVVTPSRGFCIEMGSSVVVILGAHFGLPLSTTHCQVGATMGVALLEGTRGFNKQVLLRTAFGWIFTCLFVAALAGALSALGAYAPSATSSACAQENATLESREAVVRTRARELRAFL